MIFAIIRRFSLSPAVGPKLMTVSCRAILGPALSSSFTRYGYSTNAVKSFPFSKDHSFDVNEMAQKHYDAMKNKKTRVDAYKSPKIDTKEFGTTNAFDANETLIKASRLAELAETKGAGASMTKKPQPEAPKEKKKVSSNKVLSKEDLITKNVFDENEVMEKAARLAEQAKPFQPPGEEFVKEAFMTENPFDENETKIKAARLAEQAAKKKAARAV